jgi:hypothetical protein
VNVLALDTATSAVAHSEHLNTARSARVAQFLERIGGLDRTETTAAERLIRRPRPSTTRRAHRDASPPVGGRVARVCPGTERRKLAVRRSHPAADTSMPFCVLDDALEDFVRSRCSGRVSWHGVVRATSTLHGPTIPTDRRGPLDTMAEPAAAGPVRLGLADYWSSWRGQMMTTPGLGSLITSTAVQFGSGCSPS